MSNQWKPKAWIAIVLGILLQPFTFLYLNRPKLFWLYFFPATFASAIDWRFGGFYSLIFVVICPVHAYLVVKSFEPTDQRAWYSRWWGIPAIYLVMLPSIFLLRAFFYEPFYIPSSAMNPTLEVGDHILIKKYGFGTYGSFGITLLNTDVAEPEYMQRGNIYVFYPPHQESTFVKRLIGLPGDTLKFDNNEVIINGATLDTEFVFETDSGKVYEEKLGGSSHLIQRMNNRYPQITQQLLVPENCYFFMGDNRDNSSDSRIWGCVTSDKILGELVYVFH